MITEVTRTYKFNNEPVLFRINRGCVFVNARDILKAIIDHQSISEDGLFCEFVYSFFNKSKFEKDYCQFKINRVKIELEIWMSGDCASAFAKWIDPKLGNWCKEIAYGLYKHRRQIVEVEIERCRLISELNECKAQRAEILTQGKIYFGLQNLTDDEFFDILVTAEKTGQLPDIESLRNRRSVTSTDDFVKMMESIFRHKPTKHEVLPQSN